MYIAIIIFFRFYFFYQYMVVFLFNTVIYVFLLLGVRILIVWLPWLRVFYAFSSVVRQMPGYNSPRWGTARTHPKFLCCSMYCLFCVVLWIVCKCVLYYCHRVPTQLQLTNISYNIIIPVQNSGPLCQYTFHISKRHRVSKPRPARQYSAAGAQICKLRIYYKNYTVIRAV